MLNILLGNPNFIGSVVACVLDNTVPGKSTVVPTKSDSDAMFCLQSY